MKDKNAHGMGELSLPLLLPHFLYKAKTRYLELIPSTLLCFGVTAWFSALDVHLGTLEKKTNKKQMPGLHTQKF